MPLLPNTSSIYVFLRCYYSVDANCIMWAYVNTYNECFNQQVYFNMLDLYVGVFWKRKYNLSALHHFKSWILLRAVADKLSWLKTTHRYNPRGYGIYCNKLYYYCNQSNHLVIGRKEWTWMSRVKHVCRINCDVKEANWMPNVKNLLTVCNVCRKSIKTHENNVISHNKFHKKVVLFFDVAL